MPLTIFFFVFFIVVVVASSIMYTVERGKYDPIQKYVRAV
jgi:hypothetical protein